MTTPPPDLVSLSLTLRPAAPPPPNANPPAWWGRAAHALLLKVVRQADENLANELHENGSTLRPFTASTLIGYSQQRGIEMERLYSLRLTGLNQEVSTHLLNASQAGGALQAGQAIALDYFPFQVVDNSLQSETDPAGPPAAQARRGLSGRTSYQALSAPYLLAKTQPERQVSLKFFSPASWKSAAGMHIPLPMPELVFNSLLNRWNAFAPVAFPGELRRYAAECLAISRYRLSSRTIPQKRGSQRIGCVGEATYTSVHYDRYWMSLAQTLADYAFYAGVGINTTQGMGQCWRARPPARDGQRRGEE